MLPAARSAWALMREVAQRFGRDGCGLMAAATAYYGLLSLIPLGALAVSIFGRVLGSSQAAEEQVLVLLRSLVPLEAPAVEQAIRGWPQPRGSWFVEVVSVLGLLWAGSRLFRTLEEVLTRISSGQAPARHLFARNLLALAATAGAALLFVAITVVTAATGALRETVAAALPEAAADGDLLQRLGLILGAWLMFLLMYQSLPQPRIAWLHSAAGAAVAAVMWEAARMTFQRLVIHSAAYGRLYGSLAGIMLVAIWIYVTAAVMLLGAELAVALQGRAGGGGQPCSA